MGPVDRGFFPRHILSRDRFNPFRTAVPFRGQTSQILSNLSLKRDCSPKRVKAGGEKKGLWARRGLAGKFPCDPHHIRRRLHCYSPRPALVPSASRPGGGEGRYLLLIALVI